ncbi:MAG TPA: tRNA uridine(34) 5-carboxymethylaminomethyl modification radical SAM/GNAT enzyme Elp3 [Candidatus Moranbacteria bacterium]|nr:tRNA uridine(34) 5-carboxymethylaminomethyl modification radical SAM/GNAT enzyme Elp3 [Candidatus Moranbacteria bacterium]
MNPAYDNFIKLAIKRNVKNSEDFSQIKKDLCKKLRLPLPTNADLREIYNKLIEKKEIKPSANLEKVMMSRSIRTQSGVAVVAVLTKPFPCPGKCLYCPTEPKMPKSYLSNEPAVMRAIFSKFNPYAQVQNRLRSLELNGHKTDKIELIVMGGTFSYLPKKYQRWFITECFRACNEYTKHKTYNTKHVTKNLLLIEQRKNEKARHRIIGLTLETRPDYISEKEIINFRNLGCTRVELGVQNIFDDILKINSRGHNVEATIEASKLLKDAGFKINYHIMPGLPGSNSKRDLEMFQKLFSNPDFRPDMLKIYPTVVVKNSDLYKAWKQGKYNPMSDKQFEKLVLEIKNKIIPPYVRISRLVRDVPSTSIIAGPKLSNLRQLIIPRSNCQCIRCREVKLDYKINEKIILDRIDYNASGGKEIFLQFVSKDKKKLFALLRLRVPFICHSRESGNLAKQIKIKNWIPGQVGNDKLYDYMPILRNSAIIREVHTYGKMTEISRKDNKSPQHIGLGKKLIAEAERIAKQDFGIKKIAVISGVGVRGYYKKLEYRLEDTYMVKNI